jgi:cytosine/adenosine deaminase-related metal-dependent hydrolase
MPNRASAARRLVRWLPVVAAALAAGCGGSRHPVATADGGVDANVPLDGGGDLDGGGSRDGGPVGSVVSPPAEVLATGAGGLLLRGTVLTPTGVLDPGEVLVVGNTITCVAADCSATAGAATATIVATHGIISPGLIDSHNHLAYDFLGEWIAPVPYVDRYTWANDPTYEAFIAPYADQRSTAAVYCPAAKWGELRAIVHGTTTVLGGSAQQGCVNIFVRNPDHYDGIGNEQLATNIANPGDITDAQAVTYVGRFTAASPLTRLAVHMAEGTDPSLAEEFDSFAGRDPRTNRHNGTSLLTGTGYGGNAVLIHAVPLTSAQLDEALATDSKMVWSPSSNIVLYGATADIGGWLTRGLTVGIGPDWTLSGEDDMLGELKYARAYGRTASIAAVTSQRLWQMATLDGAEVVGLAPTIGRLEVGARADITVIGRTGSDPYGAVIDADARDVRLTIIDGKAYYGDVALELATSVNTTCEDFDACGTPKFLCAQGVPATQTGTVSRTDETVEAVRLQLMALLAGYTGTDGLPRTDLLPLASECAP